MSGQRHAPAALYPRERTAGTHWTGGWVGPRAGLDIEDRGKILCPCRESNPDRLQVEYSQPATRKSLRLWRCAGGNGTYYKGY